MLRNRSRTVTYKQALMAADQNPFSTSGTKSFTKQTPSYLGSPRVFNGFLSKIISDSENTVEVRFLTPRIHLILQNRFCRIKTCQVPHPQFLKSSALALIESINEQNIDEKLSKPVTRIALFGAKLNVEISSTRSSPESPNYLGDFGIMTRDSQVWSPFSSTPVREFSRLLSLKEMEMCEDYTCVITRGPNPKTTHIYDDCIAESCRGDDPELFNVKKMENGFESRVLESDSLDLLSVEQGKD